MAGWTQRASMPTAARYAPSAGAADGRVWSLNGSGPVGEVLNRHEAYDPVTNTWTGKAAHPKGAAVVDLCYAKGNTYTFGGAVYDGSLAYNCIVEAYRYNVASNTWTALANLPDALGRLPFGTVWDEAANSDQIIIMSGSNDYVYYGSPVHDDYLIYTISTNSYSRVTLPDTGENGYRAFAVYGGVIHGAEIGFFGDTPGYVPVGSGTFTTYSTSVRGGSLYPEVVKGVYDGKLWYVGRDNNYVTKSVIGYRDLTAAPYTGELTYTRTNSPASSVRSPSRQIAGQYLYLLGGETGDPVQSTNRVDRYDFVFTQAPTTVTPANGSTVNNDLATLGQTIVANNEYVQAHWQLATDPAFTQNVRNVYRPLPPTVNYDGSYAFAEPLFLSGTVTRKILQSVSEELFQGTWYLRARGYNKPHATPWSTVNTITVTHPPAAAIVSPTGGQALLFGANGDVTLQWAFSDTSETDYQTAYQIIVERNDTGALLLDTGKVTSQTARSYAWSLPAANKDFTIRWKIRVWDSDNIAGTYTPYSTFSMSDAPVVSITVPAEGAVISNGSPTVSWTFTATGGRTQSTYRVRYYSENDVLQYDTGVLLGAATTYTPDQQVVGVGAFYVRVDVEDNGGLDGFDVNNFTTEYDTPAEPAFLASADNYGDSGYVRVAWTNAEQDYAWEAYRVYRRLAGASSWTLAYETIEQLSTYEYRDYSAASGTTTEYIVVQVADRFSQSVESAKTNPQAVEATSPQYWLIDTEDESNNMLLSSVSDDSFSDEWEEETLKVIGRGNHKDVGTRYGYTGSLTAKFRGPDARINRLKLELLKSTQTSMILRNPFGDVWLVSLGNIQIARIAGVGTDEHVDVTIPYEEVN